MAAKLLASGAELLGAYTIGLNSWAAAEPVKVRLYVNNHEPAWADDDSNYTQCSLAGYAPHTIDASSWLDSSGSDFIDFSLPTIPFTFAAYPGPSVTIYGYYIMDSPGAVYWAEKFATPYVVPLAGGSATLDVKVRMHQC